MVPGPKGGGGKSTLTEKRERGNRTIGMVDQPILDTYLMVNGAHSLSELEAENLEKGERKDKRKGGTRKTEEESRQSPALRFPDFVSRLQGGNCQGKLLLLFKANWERASKKRQNGQGKKKERRKREEICPSLPGKLDKTSLIASDKDLTTARINSPRTPKLGLTLKKEKS